MVALHGLFAITVWWEMQPRPTRDLVHVQLGDALQVRFIDGTRQAAPARPVPLPSPPAPPKPSARVRERPRPDAMTASVPAPATSAPSVAPHLYDRTGQPLLPGTTGAAPPVRGYVQRMPQGDGRVMSHDTPIEYKATRFDADFPPTDETILGQTVRRALRATHTGENKSVNLGHGIHLKCKTLFGIPTPDCGMPPAPPSKKDGDERLNMAPAPLARELAPPRRKLSECIAIYRAGKPLPHGCPVDTPGRAVDAECAEMKQAGKPLPAHCLKPAS